LNKIRFDYRIKPVLKFGWLFASQKPGFSGFHSQANGFAAPTIPATCLHAKIPAAKNALKTDIQTKKQI